MFEYVRDREIEQKRRATVYTAFLLLAMVGVIAAIVLAYA